MKQEQIMNVNMNHLYYFHVVASCGSLTKAAEKLGITQPTLSQQIGKLEEVFHSDLFVREGRGVALSTSGEVIFGYTKDIFSSVEEMIFNLNYQRYQSVEKVYRIGLSRSMPKALGLFLLKRMFENNNLGLQLPEHSYKSLASLLMKRELDFFISEKPLQFNEDVFDAISLFSPTYHIAFGRHFKWGGEASVSAQSLSGKPYFKFPAFNSVQRTFDSFFLKNGIRPNVVGESNDIDVVSAFTEANDCFCVLPKVILDSASGLKSGGVMDISTPPLCAFLLKDNDNSELRNLVSGLVRR